MIDAWLTILERVSDSRLLVLAYRGGYVERHFHQLAAERGIDPSRIELCDKRIRSRVPGDCNNGPTSPWTRFRSTDTRPLATRFGWACRS